MITKRQKIMLVDYLHAVRNSNGVAAINYMMKKYTHLSFTDIVFAIDDITKELEK